MCTISHGSQVRSLTSDECLTLNEGIELLVIILQVSFNNLNNFVWYTCWVYHNSDGSPSAWATSTTVHCRWAFNLNDFAIASHLKTGIVAQTTHETKTLPCLHIYTYQCISLYIFYTCAVFHWQCNWFWVQWVFRTTSSTIDAWSSIIDAWRWASNLNVPASAKTCIVAQARSEGVSTWTVNHFYMHWR